MCQVIDNELPNKKEKNKDDIAAATNIKITNIASKVIGRNEE